MDKSALTRLRGEIETDLGWGDAAAWSTADYETLSDRIHERTGVQLSATTLKRVWGRIAYKSSPSPTTLDALASYAGHENWRTYANAPAEERSLDAPVAELPIVIKTPPYVSPAPTSDRSGKRPVVFALLAALALLLCFFYFRPAPATAPEKTVSAPPNPDDFTFFHHPVTEGLPNSVVFTYDAAAAPTDSVFIQQSWDRRRRVKVDRAGTIHTSIYHLPGYYRATLLVGDQEVKSRDLLITSNGWTVAAGQRDAPVYLDDVPDAATGSLSVDAQRLADLGLPLQPDPPTVYLGNVGEFNGVRTDDFRFTTRLRQTYGTGAAACRNSRVMLLLRNAAIIVPLSAPGCIAELSGYVGGQSLDGKTTDLSALGVMEDNWVDLAIVGHGELLSVYLNERLALQVESRDETRDILGLRYEFTGGGSVDFARLDGREGLVWEEDFGVGR